MIRSVRLLQAARRNETARKGSCRPSGIVFGAPPRTRTPLPLRSSVVFRVWWLSCARMMGKETRDCRFLSSGVKLLVVLCGGLLPLFSSLCGRANEGSPKCPPGAPPPPPCMAGAPARLLQFSEARPAPCRARPHKYDVLLVKLLSSEFNRARAKISLLSLHVLS
jgi:hypothetical protein